MADNWLIIKAKSLKIVDLTIKFNKFFYLLKSINFVNSTIVYAFCEQCKQWRQEKISLYRALSETSCATFTLRKAQDPHGT